MKFDFEKFFLVATHIWLFTAFLVMSGTVSFEKIWTFAFGWTIGCAISGFITARK